MELRQNSKTENIDGNQTSGWKQTYTFDRYGNRRFDAANTTTMPASFANPALTNPTISTTDNRITSSGYSFDNSGNTTASANGQIFIYDAENKQVQVSNAGGVIGQYCYDGDGKRIKKYVPSTGETTIFVYDAGGKSIAEYSTIVANSTDAKVAYLTNDHLGSPRVNTDANGAVTSRHDYHPFGEEVLTSQRSLTLGYTADTVRKQFTGYERDNETSLDFAQARYHSYNLGRFTSPDPLLLSANLSLPQTWNRYAYSVNAPLTVVDPEGLYPSPAFNCSDTVKTCLNDEQRRILNASQVKVGKETFSGEDLYKKLSEKQQNAFINMTDKLASFKMTDGSSFLSQVRNVTEFKNDRILATVKSDLAMHLKDSSQFSKVSAGQHKPFDAVSYKNNDTTFGNIQISLNEKRDGADIDMDVGNMKSGDVAGPVVHVVEVVINKIFDRQTNQDKIRRILLADPKVQTITPSADPKFNRRQK